MSIICQATAFFSPNGAKAFSRGREPPELWRSMIFSPNGAKEHWTPVRLSPLQG